MQLKASGITDIEKRSRAQNPDLHELDLDIIKKTREKDKIETVNNKVQLVNEQVEAWCRRIIDKID